MLWANEKGITTGYTDSSGNPTGYFGVDDPCTREQVVTFIWRAAGKPKPGTSKNPFKDVKKGKYYYDAVLWAVKNSITTGISDTKFGVGKDCTRGMVVTFLYRYYN